MAKEINVENFRRLTTIWQNETAVLSDPNKILQHHALQEIVAYGEDVIPLILHAFKQEADIGWSMALHQITNITHPSLEEKDAGNLKKIRDAWIKWGEVNGYIEKAE